MSGKTFHRSNKNQEEQFAEVAVTDHLTSLPIPEVILDIGINLCQVSYSFWKTVTVAIF